MSINRFEALLATSTHMTPVMRLVGGCLGARAPNMNCGSFDKELVGVMPVSAVLLAAISVRTTINGSAIEPSHQLTPNHACAVQTAKMPSTGTPSHEIHNGSSMSRSTS